MTFKTKEDNKEAQKKWYSNEKNAFKKNRAKILKKLETDGGVRYQSILTYKIPLNEANIYRKRFKLPLFREEPEQPDSTKALIAEINRQKTEQRLTDQQIKLAEETREKTKKLTKTRKQVEEQAERLPYGVNVPVIKDNILTFNDIKNYFRRIADDMPAIMSYTSWEGYFGATDTAKGKFKTVLELINCKVDENLIPCLKNYKKLINAIKKAYPNKNTYKNYVQSVLKVLDFYPMIQQTYGLKEARDYIYNEFTSSKTTATTSDITRRLTETVDPFSSIKEKVRNAYEKSSQQALLIELYNELTLRDDYGFIEIVNKETDIKKEELNFLLIKPKKVELYLQSYKTVNKYGTIQHVFPETKEVTKMIRDSLKKKPRKYLIIKDSIYQKLTTSKETNNKLLGDDPTYGSKGALSSFINDMLITSGVKPKNQAKTDTHNRGSINLLRKSTVSETLKDIRDVNEDKREELSKQMLHSPATQLNYVRKLGIDKMSEDQMEKVDSEFGNDDKEGKKKRKILKKNSN